MLLAAKWNSSAVFMAAAAAALCAALAALSLSRLAGTGAAGRSSSIDATLKGATTAGT
jgi:AAHS family 4-hydroxybenzoate transporter-like MFS transporter